MRKEEQDIVGLLRSIYLRRIAQRVHLHPRGLHLDHDRPLAVDGRPGHGSVRGFHRVRAPSQSKSVDVALVRIAPLRRLLGILLAIHIQLQRDGQGGHAPGRQPDGRRRPQAPFGRRRRTFSPQRPAVESAGQIGLPVRTLDGPLFHARAGRHRDARLVVVLRDALRRL